MTIGCCGASVAGIGFSRLRHPRSRSLVDFARRQRGWSREQWASGVERLRERGLVGDYDALTPAGIELRSQVEDLTDQLAHAPWRSLSDDDAKQVAMVARVSREGVQSSNLAKLDLLALGLFPGDAFGPRYGEHL